MLGTWLADFVAGYVTISCYGRHVPEFINRATQNRLVVWDISHQADGSTRLTTLRKNIPFLRRIARETKIKFRFGQRVGLPFIVGQVVSRKLFLAGALVFIVGLYMLSSLVWSVEVEGEKTVSPETVQSVAAELGIRKWQWIRSLPDTDILQLKMQEKMPQMSNVLVILQGTRVLIKVDEKVPPTVPQNTVPQNIIAVKKGTIRSVQAIKGKSAVSTGQLVQQGQLLISGSIGDGQTFVAARGDVLAEVWYTSVIDVPLKVNQDQMTGEKITKDFVVFGNKPIQVWGYGQSPFVSTTAQEHDFNLAWRGYSLPITVKRVDYFETQPVEITRTPAEARELALKLAQNDAAAGAGETFKLLEQKFVVEPEVRDGVFHAQILTKAEEQIGRAEPLSGP
ncbi:MAG: sporulation protein YqfD [Bacilli bacterium]|nr:sporulation protein YqfD [Bacilli bacterium]